MRGGFQQSKTGRYLAAGVLPWYAAVVGLLLGVWLAAPSAAQSEWPGDDPSAWLVEASVQARRVSGVGDGLTAALQTKGALLAHIAAAQQARGETEAAAKNEQLVALCVRALAHDGEDGWVRATQARALSEHGRADEAAAIIKQIDNPGERAVARAWVRGDTASDASMASASPRFASQWAWHTTQQTIRGEAASVARLGTLRDAQVWVEVLSDPADRAWASVGVAEGLAEPLPRTQAKDIAAPRAEAEGTTEIDLVADASAIKSKPVSDPETQVSISPEVENVAEAEAEIQTQVPVEVELATDPAETAISLKDQPIAPAEFQTQRSEIQAEGQAAADKTDSDAMAAGAVESMESTDPLSEQSDAMPSVEASPNVDSEPATASVVTPTVEVPAELADDPKTAAQASAKSLVVNASADTQPEADPKTLTVNEPDSASHLQTAVEPKSVPDTAGPKSEGRAQAEAATEAEAMADASVVPPMPTADTAQVPAVTQPDAVESSEPLPVSSALPLPAETAPASIPLVPNLATLADPGAVLNDPSVINNDLIDFDFTTTKGVFTVRVHRRWAPLAAERFCALAAAGYYHNQRFFRVVPGFVVQWGIHGYPNVAAAWRTQTLPDEPRTQPNRRGTIVFAAATQPNTRTTQVFINLADNAFLDDLGFVPFGEVVRGMDVVDSLFGGHGEAPSAQQRDIQLQGNAFLDAKYPALDSVVSVQFAPTE